MRWLIFIAAVCLYQVSAKDPAKVSQKVLKRSFTIDFDHDTFQKDGKPFFYVSGIMHYFRVPFYYWEDRLDKMYAAGMDAVQTYVAWNLHEPMPGVYDFKDQQDLPAFLTAAQKAGLLVILRVGPYICGEWEYGGFPAWLLSDNETMTVRTMDKKYLAAVDRWLGVVLPLIKPYLYSNGGPIIMVQMENEYGSYKTEACSPRGPQYLRHLRDTFLSHLGNDFVLFTTDGSTLDYMKCGTVDGAYATVDFAPDPNATKAFADMRKHNPKGPLVDSECYTGWLDHWGGGHHRGSTDILIQGLQANRDIKASTSLYMFEGGTNFGYMSGADPGFALCPTSYDYDSPLTEAGDITPKYMALRKFVSQYKVLPKVPENSTKYQHGPILMRKVGSVVELMKVITSPPLTTLFPLNMEQANHFYGFTLYRHVLKKSYVKAEFKATGIRDRGHVLFDGAPSGVLDRYGSNSFQASGKAGQIVDIVVENQGRINYGDDINDNKKGLISNVTFGGEILSHWTMYPIDFTKVFDYLAHKHLPPRQENLKYRSFKKQAPNDPTVYKGEFVLKSAQPADTFLQMCGWTKGQAFINGFNLGRYWPIKGPQVTLYIPAGTLYAAPKPNVLVMVELDGAPSTHNATAHDYVQLVKDPIIDGRCSSPSSIERHRVVLHLATERQRT
jgi:beta-galactosidase